MRTKWDLTLNLQWNKPAQIRFWVKNNKFQSSHKNYCMASEDYGYSHTSHSDSFNCAVFGAWKLCWTGKNNMVWNDIMCMFHRHSISSVYCSNMTVVNSYPISCCVTNMFCFHLMSRLKIFFPLSLIYLISFLSLFRFYLQFSADISSSAGIAFAVDNFTLSMECFLESEYCSFIIFIFCHFLFWDERSSHFKNK